MGKGGHTRRDSFKPSFDTVSETYQAMSTQQGDSAFSGPIPVSASSGFAWAAVRRKDDITSVISDGSKSQFSALDPSFAKSTYGLPKLGNQDYFLHRADSKREMRKQLRNLSNPPESFDSADLYHSQDISKMAALAKSMVVYKINTFIIFFLLRIIFVKHKFAHIMNCVYRITRMKKTISSSQDLCCYDRIEWMNSCIRTRIRYVRRIGNQDLKEVK